MALTEEQVQRLADEVGEIDLDDPDIVAYLREVLAAELVAEKRWRANFRLQRMLREDEMMSKIAEQLAKTRDRINAIRQLLK